MRKGNTAANTPLTETECKVLIGMALGKKKGTLAHELNVTEAAIITHAANIRIRTGTHRLEHALSVANARGDITIHPQCQEPEPAIEGRELQVLICLARGYSLEKTAKHVGIAVSTVKLDIAKLYQKLDAKTRPHLVYRGFETSNLVINRRNKE